MENMHYLIESITDIFIRGNPKVKIEVILKSRNRSELQEYLHSVYLEYLEEGDSAINGEELIDCDIENGDLPIEYSDKLYVCYANCWGGEVCRSYQIISETDLNKADEI